MYEMNRKSNLMDARLLWQLGRWEDLVAIEVSVPRNGRMSDANAELALFKSQALFQVGNVEEATTLVRDLKSAGVSKMLIMESLWGGAQISLARSWMLAGRKLMGDAAIKAAVEVNDHCGDIGLTTELRAQGEWSRVRQSMHEESSHSAIQRKLFIDCGGFDGCSALKFLLSFPEFDAVTFEPNPDLWHYYDELPTRLIKKAVHTYDGYVSFRIDAIDGDGSSLIESKVVDFHQKMSNDESPLISVPCADLSAFVAEKAIEYDKIVLKLDVEGAEYDILDKMLEEGTLSLVDQLYCEFHYDRIDIEPERHRAILARSRAVTLVEPWDANYSVFKLAPKDNEDQMKMRKQIVKDILNVRQKMEKLRW